jgi:hypothetical protein
MELTAESRDAISGVASAPQNSSILRQQSVGGPSYPELPPYAVTNVTTVITNAGLALQKSVQRYAIRCR